MKGIVHLQVTPSPQLKVRNLIDVVILDLSLIVNREDRSDHIANFLFFFDKTADFTISLARRGGVT